MNWYNFFQWNQAKVKMLGGIWFHFLQVLLSDCACLWSDILPLKLLHLLSCAFKVQHEQSKVHRKVIEQFFCKSSGFLRHQSGKPWSCLLISLSWKCFQVAFKVQAASIVATLFLWLHFLASFPFFRQSCSTIRRVATTKRQHEWRLPWWNQSRLIYSYKVIGPNSDAILRKLLFYYRYWEKYETIILKRRSWSPDGGPFKNSKGSSYQWGKGDLLYQRFSTPLTLPSCHPYLLLWRASRQSMSSPML